MKVRMEFVALLFGALAMAAGACVPADLYGLTFTGELSGADALLSGDPDGDDYVGVTGANNVVKIRNAGVLPTGADFTALVTAPLILIGLALLSLLRRRPVCVAVMNVRQRPESARAGP